MLARLEHRLPHGDRWVYEPKLDGFRGLLWHQTSGTVHLLSRNLRDLAPWFPELMPAGRALPPGTLVDGEIVIANTLGHADFGALQRRLTTGRREAGATAAARPAVLLGFDVVEFDGVRVGDRPLCERRRLLENLVSTRDTCLQLVDQTDSCELAEQWLTLIPSLEGVVAKRRDGRYAPGRREWVKVKRQRTADCVVIGVARNDTAPSLVLGLRHADGELHHFGVTRPSRTALSEPCAPVLDVIADEHSIRSRWQHEAVPAWQRVKPSAVCEVAYTLLDFLVARNCVLKLRLVTRMSLTLGDEARADERRACRH